MKINTDGLVMLSVAGQINSAVWPASRAYRVGGDGVLRVLPGTGGICYTHVIGDNAVSLKGDHVEPGVSIKAGSNDENAALNTLACVGNEAAVITGSAKGARGTVCGKHGGVDHVMVDFPNATIERLCIGDKIQIRAFGQGAEIEGFSDLKVMNCDPALLKKWGISKSKGRLEVPVTHLVPSKIMGSGLGATSCYSGDYDIQLFDRQVVRAYKLDSLRFGDLVAIVDADHSYGRRYLQGAVSVGVVVHSCSDMSGHGPGVTTLLTSPEGVIKPKIAKSANIGALMGLGRWRKGKR
ncbi:MAG: DUF4438 domain-containing protein [Deltaproteobacteria bacterium]|nr:DUF4438 domain-containing protein [Deltaproteobacteria bacterium]